MSNRYSNINMLLKIIKDNLGDAKKPECFMKWTVSFRRPTKWGGRQAAFIRCTIKNQKATNRKYPTAWGHTVNLVCAEKTESWLGIWGLADWMYCISGQTTGT